MARFRKSFSVFLILLLAISFWTMPVSAYPPDEASGKYHCAQAPFGMGFGDDDEDDVNIIFIMNSLILKLFWIAW